MRPRDLSTDGGQGRRCRRLVVAWSATALFLCTGGFSTYLTLHVFDSQDGGARWLEIYPFAIVAVGGAGALYTALRPLRPTTWPWPIYPALGLMAWALLSASWSVSSGTTATNALLDVGIMAFACWFGWQLTVREQIWSVMIACSSAVALSAIAIVWLPQYGRMFPDWHPKDHWQGIFGNRNSLSPVCGLGLLALAGFVATRPRRRALGGVALLALLHVAVLRGSLGATTVAALAASGVVALLVPAVVQLRRTRVPAAVVAGAAAVLLTASIAWAFAHMDRLAETFGRDVTFTGRRPIWADVRRIIALHPLRGFGYSAFWDRPDLTAATYQRVQSMYGSAHNSALEIMLGLGVVGLILMLVSFLAGLVGLSRQVWHHPSLRAWWWAIVFTFAVVQNLTESFVLFHSYLWVLVVAAGLAPFNTADDVRERRRLRLLVDLDADDDSTSTMGVDELNDHPTDTIPTT